MENRKLANSDLQKVVEIAKKKGYKVRTFESSGSVINQIFIEDQIGRLGSCSAYFGGVQFSTMHKSKSGSGNGSGFGQLVKGEDFNDPENLDVCFISFHYWAGSRERQGVTKYNGWSDYRQPKVNQILKYYEL
jgi:hypothetical protein